MTRSPLLMPYLMSMFTIWLERRIRSQKVNFFSTPFWLVQIMASLFRSFLAQASITVETEVEVLGDIDVEVPVGFIVIGHVRYRSALGLAHAGKGSLHQR